MTQPKRDSLSTHTTLENTGQAHIEALRCSVERLNYLAAPLTDGS